MSLIYFALNRLESKSEKGDAKGSSLISERTRADEYVLNTRRASMPLWVVVLVVLCLIGVVIGWVLTSQLKDIKGVKALSLVGETKSVPQLPVIETSQVASANNVNNPESMNHANARLEEFEPLNSAQIQQIQQVQQVQATINNTSNVNTAKQDVPIKTSLESALGNNSLAVNRDLVNQDIKQDIKQDINVEQKRAEAFTKDVIAKNDPVSRIEIKIESNRNDIKLATKNSRNKSDSAIQKTQEDINTQEVTILIQSIKSAIKNAKLNEADQMLIKLKGYLEPESITLLHLHAWRQMNGGDQDTAKAIYQQIIMRNPDDETAAVNLALIYWKSGNHIEASRVIESIGERRPNSEVIQNYRRQFGVKK